MPCRSLRAPRPMEPARPHPEMPGPVRRGPLVPAEGARTRPGTAARLCRLGHSRRARRRRGETAPSARSARRSRPSDNDARRCRVRVGEAARQCRPVRRGLSLLFPGEFAIPRVLDGERDRIRRGGVPTAYRRPDRNLHIRALCDDGARREPLGDAGPCRRHAAFRHEPRRADRRQPLARRRSRRTEGRRPHPRCAPGGRPGKLRRGPGSGAPPDGRVRSASATDRPRGGAGHRQDAGQHHHLGDGGPFVSEGACGLLPARSARHQSIVLFPPIRSTGIPTLSIAARGRWSSSGWPNTGAACCRYAC